MNKDWYPIWNAKRNNVTQLQLNGWENDDSTFNDLRYSFVKEFANIKESNSVLDIGCGTGMLLKNISCKNKVGIDFSPRQIENIDPSIDAYFLCGDFLDIEFNQKFDKVICFGILQYIKQKDVCKFIEKAISLANENVCFFDIPNLSMFDENQSMRHFKKPDISFFEKDFFYKFSNNVIIQDWKLANYRYNGIRYNVNITI